MIALYGNPVNYDTLWLSEHLKIGWMRILSHFISLKDASTSPLVNYDAFSGVSTNENKLVLWWPQLFLRSQI